MSRRTIIILAIIAVVIIGLAIAVLLTGDRYLDTPAENNNVNQQTNSGNLPSDGSVNNQPEFQEPVLNDDQRTIISVSRIFAERYGSYSSDTNGQNLLDAKLLATASLATELDILRAGLNPGGEFYGITSKALKVEILNLNETAGTAAVEVNLQRQEIKNNNEIVYYQKLKLELIKIDNKWFINTANWQ